MSLPKIAVFVWLMFILSLFCKVRGRCVEGTTYDPSKWDGSYTFDYQIVGPVDWWLGYEVYFQFINFSVPNNWVDYAYYFVEGNPPGTTVSFLTIEETCCPPPPNRAWMPGNSLIRISPNNSTVGVFELTFRVSCGGVNVTKCRYLNYTILPSVTRNPITGSVPPLEAQNDLDRLMIEKGARHCNNETIFRNGIWEGGVWYYDGMNNYQSIAEYTRNTSWYICSDWIAQVYRDGYVLANNGRIPGWRVFPHGVYRDCLRTSNQRSCDAVLFLANSSAYSNAGGGLHSDLSRETAYILNSYILAKKLTNQTYPKLELSHEFAINHLEQWFIQFAPHLMQPFMVGLTSQALMLYYLEINQDPRIPYLLKITCDWLWDNYWINESLAFHYNSETPWPSPAPDLNGLVSIPFAFVYAYTGEDTYRQKIDLILKGSARYAWLDGGKQFSQTYRGVFEVYKYLANPWIVGSPPQPSSTTLFPSTPMTTTSSSSTLPSSPSSSSPSSSSTSTTTRMSNRNAILPNVELIFGLLVVLLYQLIF